MQKQHGQADYFVDGKIGYPASLGAEEIRPADAPPTDERANEVKAAARPQLRFGRMFKDLERPPENDDGLVALGQAMMDSPDFGDNLSLPAGYTYLAQFIAHDVSFEKNNNIPAGPVAAGNAIQLRTPSLDLDSLYGEGPKTKSSSHLYDGARFKIGETKADFFGDANRRYANDLYRENDENPHEPLIADLRNDDNLAVAQTHVAFLKFHNKVVERLSDEGFSGDILFEEAKEKVIRHYQWIVLNDLLPKIIDEDVLRKAHESSSDLVPDQAKGSFMPVEFSLAGFRLGHSMLRATYEWNRVFQSPTRGDRRVAKFADLIHQTGFRAETLGKGKNLGSPWIIDWTRFYDFTGHNGIATNPKFNWAKKIDTTLAADLKHFDMFLKHITDERFRSLAVADLVRGSRMQLPTGQAVAERIKLPCMRAADILEGPHMEVLRKHGFHKKTPLWYYILKEAEFYRGGQRLGPVGSFIVAETLVNLIRASRISIIRGNPWRPDLGQIMPDRFGMTDLLVFANVVNPLGS
jgi:hypothetical protein